MILIEHLNYIKSFHKKQGFFCALKVSNIKGLEPIFRLVFLKFIVISICIKIRRNPPCGGFLKGLSAPFFSPYLPLQPSFEFCISVIFFSKFLRLDETSAPSIDVVFIFASGRFTKLTL